MSSESTQVSFTTADPVVITFTTSLVLKGTYKPDGTVTLMIDGAAGGTATCDASGNFSFATPVYSNVTHKFSVVGN